MDRAVVGTPRQLLGAAEWVHATGRSRSDVHLTVLLPADANSAQQTLALLADDPWPACDVVRLRGTRDRYSWLREMTRSSGTVEALLIGEYRLTLLRELADRLRPDELVLTDDGNATVLVANHRNRRNSGRRGLDSLRLNGSTDSRKHLHRIAGLHGREPDRLVYSTIYGLAPQQPDRVEGHRFDHLMSRGDIPAMGRDGVVLGSTLAESGIIGVETYERLVGELLTNLDACEYWPHRREDPAKVRHLADRFGLRVRSWDMPVERAILSGAQRPSAVGAVVSSALDSLAVMFPDMTVIGHPPAFDDVSVAARWSMEIVLRASYANRHVARPSSIDRPDRWTAQSDMAPEGIPAA